MTWMAEDELVLRREIAVPMENQEHLLMILRLTLRNYSELSSLAG